MGSICPSRMYRVLSESVSQTGFPGEDYVLKGLKKKKRFMFTVIPVLLMNNQIAEQAGTLENMGKRQK